jgi:hypothetical protein
MLRDIMEFDGKGFLWMIIIHGGPFFVYVKVVIKNARFLMAENGIKTSF